MRKKQLLTILFIVTFFISPVYTNAEEMNDKQMIKIAKEFLPVDSVLVSPNTPSFDQPFLLDDLDDDGENELIMTFEIKDKEQPFPSKYGVILLKRKKESWVKIWETNATGVGLHYSDVADITGDGMKEYLFGIAIGASAGNTLEIFQWDHHSLKKIGDVPYHMLDIVNGQHDGLAVWQRYIADTYFVEVLTWNSQKLEQDEKLYSEYYPVIETFYKEKLANMDAWFYWYTLADAQMKANLFGEATESIEKGLELANQLSMRDIVESFHQLRHKIEEMKQ